MLAARVVGLDIAGVDLVAARHSRPLEEQGGAIVEVNAGPGLLMHLKPASGEPRPVGRAIVDHLFRGRRAGRIPIVGITGAHGTTMARAPGRLAAATERQARSAWPAATACSSSAAASTRATAPTGKPATAC